MTPATGMRRAAEALEPHAVLAVAGGVAIGCEAARIDTGSTAWVLVGAAAAFTAMVLAWHEQDRLRLLPLAGIALAFHLMWIWAHETLGAVGDLDTNAVYPVYGHEFLAGRFPETEYPAGGVVLFALEAWLGGDSADTPNRLVMVPFQLACVVAIWGLRTNHSRWLAAVIALWPLSTYYWEYRFDLVPAAFLAVGLLLAWRDRWAWAGVALALGAWVKWTPAVAVVVLAAWLLAGRRWRESVRFAGAFAAAYVAVNLPFFLWNPHNFLAPFRSQSGRSITNESVWFFPLKALGLTSGDEASEWKPAGAPHAADLVAVGVQLLLIATLVLLAIRHRDRLRPALALAALAPVVFLLTNKIFSAQFLVVVGVGWAIAAALLVRSRREQLLCGALLMVASFANAFVWPYDLPGAVLSWRPFSLLLFTTGFALTGMLVVRAATFAEAEERVPARPGPRARAAPSFGGLERATVAGAAAFFAIVAVVAVALPYRTTHSLTLGAWSRTIAESGSFHLGALDVQLNRPLFAVLQGVGWQLVGHEEWLGRLLAVAFGAGLVACVWLLAGLLAPQPPERTVLRAFAVAAVLASSVFAAVVAAGGPDVPVAALTAATALLLWSPRVPLRLYLVTTAAAATMLAKPTGVLAIAGLALATLVLTKRAKAIEGLVGLAVATVGVALYGWLEARRLEEPFWSFATADDEDYWAAGTSWLDATLAADWLGASARLLVLFGFAYAVARAAGGPARTALAVAGPAAIVLSLVGPAVAAHDVPYPFDRVGPGAFAFVLLAAAVLVAPFGPASDPLERRTYVALLAWLAPAAVVWVGAAASEARLLSVTWPALALLVGAALTVATLALVRLAPAAALLPGGAVVLLVLANIVAIDGLGRSGWRHLLEEGPDDAHAYGELAPALALARANVGPTDRVAANDARIAYFFPGQVRVVDGEACGEAAGSDYLALDLGAGGANEPLRWLQCRRPRLHLVGQRGAAQAVFAVDTPATPPDPAACEISGYPGQMHDAVFADGVDYARARAVVGRARGAGFVQARIERTGCATFRVLNTGLPDTPAGQADFRHEAESVGLPVEFVPAMRFPEVPVNVPPLRG